MVTTAGRRAGAPRSWSATAPSACSALPPTGASVAVSGKRFQVAGIFHTGNRFVDNGVVLPLEAVQSAGATTREVTTFGVQVEAGSRPAEVARALERRFPGTTR